MGNNRITSKEVWTANAITQNTAESFTLDIDEYKPEGFLGLYWKLTGAGNADVTVTISYDGTTFVNPSSWTTEGTLASAFGAASGTSGAEYIDITKGLATFFKAIKFTFTEQNAGAIAVTLGYVVQ
jgi:hypothetical protein